MARMTGSTIKELNATSSGSADVRSIFEEAKNLLQLTGRRTVLFIGKLLLISPYVATHTGSDEVQRFNKAQQVRFFSH